MGPLVLGIALAGEPDVTWLRWDAPASCPDAERVEAATATRLGRRLDVAEIEVEGVVQERGAAGLQLTLRTKREGVSDVRTMTSPTCEPLVDAAALVVAVAVDPVAAASTIEPEVFVPVAPPVEVEPLPVAIAPTTTRTSAAPPRAPRDRRPTDLRLATMGGVEIGALPGISGGPNLALALAWTWLRIEAAGFYLAPRTATVAAGSVRVQMGAAGVRACVRVGRRRLEVPVCAGVEVGANRGRGRDVPDDRVAHGLWVAPAASAGMLGWVTPRVAVGGRVEVAIPVDRTGFHVQDPGDPVGLWSPAAVSVRIWAGIEVKLWGRGDGFGRGRRGNP